MSFLQGNPEEWLPGLIELGDIMVDSLIPEAWPECREKMRGEICHEDAVTKVFVRQLHKAKKKICPRMSFQIISQHPVYPSDDDTGIIDIVVMFGGDEDYYLGYECKWLEKKRDKKSDSGLVGEYLGEGGLGCFLSGKYAPCMPVGYMVGYVASGDVAVAEAKVEARMERRKMPSPENRRQVGEMRFSQACYRRNAPLQNIVIGHIFLPYKHNSFH
ncbi:hypothetical protein [Pseudodesulfovibrio indicus]|uniref:hypothetical protein n=1 Tax=Pseudodesulfovibrio indicus TaxID=1716143 RepID=UPI00293053BE|nr:hypothetical protein [Pseudodesulfovibrio indicus]